jgi:hypothetical protein
LSGNLSSALSVSEWGVNDANLSVNMNASVGSTFSVKWLLTSLGVGRFYGTCLGSFYSKSFVFNRLREGFKMLRKIISFTWV